ncbi:MAG: delta-60 repeat domain-containing protein [Kofleriaceae bacterium]
MNTKVNFVSLALAFTAACGADDEHHHDPDASPSADADRTPDSATTPDATPFVAPAPMSSSLSPTTEDQLHAVVAAPGGAWYVAGFAADTLGGARAVVLGKLTPTGPDASFGTGGFVTTSLGFTGGADEIDLVVQPDGKLVVSATIADELDATDSDIGLARYTATGTLDATFGTAGVARVDIATVPGGGATADKSRGLATDASGRLYVHAVARDPGTVRTDSDFAVVRLTADGALDATFGTAGMHFLDLLGGDPAGSLNATARGIAVLDDGSILAGGYTNNPSFSTGPQAVLYKLSSAGALVPGFASGGVFFDVVLAVQTEVYGFARHGDAITTGGYGRDAGDQNDWVAMRFDATTGVRDATFGGTGEVVLDASGAMIGDNCRGAVALPDGRTLLFGSTGPSNLPAQDAAWAVLTADGALDPAFGDGLHVTPFGAGMGGNDQLWGAAVSGDNVLMVGWRGGGPAGDQTASVNDDGFAIVLPLP